MAIILIFANTEIYVQLIEKLSRRHLINSSEIFVIKGFTVRFAKLHSDSLKNEDRIPKCNQISQL